MSPPIYTPDGSEVSEIVLPDGSTASEVIDPDGNVVFEAGPDIPDGALTQDLVAWYRFEDGDARDYTATLDATFADSTAYDGTVNGATFQSNGGVTDFENGANGGAFNFKTDGDAISFNSNPLSGISSWTIVGWVNFSETTKDQNILVTDVDLLSVSFGFGTDVFNDDSFGFIVNDGTTKFSASNNSFTDTTYTHFAGVWTGSGVKFYLNGQEFSDTPEDIRQFNNQNKPLFFGSTDSRFDINDAELDDIRFYDRELSASEISDIYNATKP